MNRDADSRPARDFAEKRTFTAIGLDKMYRTSVVIRDDNGNHEARKTCPASQVKPIRRMRRERDELRAVGEVARPDFIECGRRDEIGRLLPLAEQRLINREAFDCFTWNRKGTLEIGNASNAD